MLQRVSVFLYASWLLLFILAPFIILFYLSITHASTTSFTLMNFARFFENIYLKMLVQSLLLASYSTVISLILAYPFAWILSRLPERQGKIAMLLLILPMWVNSLLRTYAWMKLLSQQGIFNAFLGFLGFEPISLLYNQNAVVMGMVYNFFPFVVLPLYTSFIKLNRQYLDAAQDLGASSWTLFRYIIGPLSWPAVKSGLLLVFIPAITVFVISELLGGAKVFLIGNLVEQQFLFAQDENFGSAIAVILILLLLIIPVLGTLFLKPWRRFYAK